MLAHVAENDNFFGPDAMKELEHRLVAQGKNATFEYYPGTGHAFANETNALGTYDEAATKVAWGRTIEFLRAHLG